jgi:hypothetical protein
MKTVKILMVHIEYIQWFMTDYYGLLAIRLIYTYIVDNMWYVYISTYTDCIYMCKFIWIICLMTVFYNKFYNKNNMYCLLYIQQMSFHTPITFKGTLF